LVLQARYQAKLELDEGHLYLSAHQKNLILKLRIQEQLV
jgi:hypothetical protein